MDRKNPMLRLEKIMDSNSPGLSYKDGLDSHTWIRMAEGKLNELLGMEKFLPVDVNLRVESETEKSGYRQIRFTIAVENSTDMPCYLLLPNKVHKPPLMICLQGHSSGAHISVGEAKYSGDEESFMLDRDFGIQAVKNGMAALCPEQRYFGERTMHPEKSGPECHVPAMAELMLGRTATGGRAWDVMCALDAVQDSFVELVDMDRVGIMGNSGGGSAAWYTAALEPRIKAVMPGSSVCSYKKSIASIKHCVCNHIPGIMNWFEMGDIAGLIAPRPLVIVSGDKDPIFPVEGVYEEFDRIRKWYELFDAKASLKLVIGDGGHKFYPDAAWPIFKEVTGW